MNDIHKTQEQLKHEQSQRASLELIIKEQQNTINYLRAEMKKITDANPEKYKALKLIESLKTNDTHYKAMKLAYSEIHVFQEVMVDWSGPSSIGDIGAMMIGALLKINTTLRQLCLIGCGIGKDGGRVIGDALAVNNSLEKLSLGPHYDEKPSILVSVIAGIGKKDNAIGDVGAKTIAAALEKNRASECCGLRPIKSHPRG